MGYSHSQVRAEKSEVESGSVVMLPAAGNQRLQLGEGKVLWKDPSCANRSTYPYGSLLALHQIPVLLQGAPLSPALHGALRITCLFNGDCPLWLSTPSCHPPTQLPLALSNSGERRREGRGGRAEELKPEEYSPHPAPALLSGKLFIPQVAF